MFGLAPSNRKPRAHFSGIGGTAMVAGAQLALEAGWEVRGSDNPLYPPTSIMVQELGVPVATGYAAANLDWAPDVVVIGNVLSRGNPEVEAVLARKLHYVSLPEWLKEVVLRQRRPVVICGTHGKTTVTALTAFLLDGAGLEPGFLIGGQPLDFAHPARLGREGGVFVIEGDEYDTAFFDKRAKFFHYLPEIALITSVEFDHGDIYGDIGEIERAFRLMLRQIPESGRLVLCADHAGAVALKPYAPCQVLTYGFDEQADFRVRIENRAGTLGPNPALTVHKQGRLWGEFVAPLPGHHNLQNVLGALAVADLLGVEPQTIEPLVEQFRGVRRRMEVFLEANGITFIDDFAHHPTAVRASIAASRSRWPGQPLWVLFEPRSNTTVTNCFQPELEEALAGADEVWLGPIHRAEAIPPDTRLDRAAVVSSLRKKGAHAGYTDDVTEIVQRIRKNAKPGDVVLILSNGAFGGIYNLLRSAFGKPQ